MPAPVTPVAPFVLPTTISVPQNTEACDATQLRVDVEEPLIGGVAGLRAAARGNGFRRRVLCTSNTVLTIYPLGAVVALVGTDLKVAPHITATTIDPSVLVVLAANTRYYIYADLIAGAPTFTVSTSVPDTALRYKAGDEQFVLISTFYTNSSGNIIPYTQDDGEYIYDTRNGLGGGAVGNLQLDGGVSTMIATVSLNDAVPAGFSRVTLDAYAQAGAANAAAFIGRNIASAENSRLILRPTNGGNDAGSCSLSGVSSSFEYLCDAATTTLWVWVAGFVWG